MVYCMAIYIYIYVRASIDVNRYASNREITLLWATDRRRKLQSQENQLGLLPWINWE